MSDKFQEQENRQSLADPRPAACERMIRILRATYTEDDNDNNE